MVFDLESAPNSRIEFMDWYDNQTEWTENHSHDDPKNTTGPLQSWFSEMIEFFPAMNGPYAYEDYDHPNLADFNIGHHIIYITFSWSSVETAYTKTRELAIKHGVGFFDVSGSNNEILVPSNA